MGFLQFGQLMKAKVILRVDHLCLEANQGHTLEKATLMILSHSERGDGELERVSLTICIVKFYGSLCLSEFRVVLGAKIAVSALSFLITSSSLNHLHRVLPFHYLRLSSSSF